MAVGCGYLLLNTLCTSMTLDISCMLRSGKDEARLTTLARKVDKNGVPLIAAILIERGLNDHIKHNMMQKSVM